MKKHLCKTVFTCVAVILVCSALFLFASAQQEGKWVTAWGTGITEIGIDGYDNLGVTVSGVTSRSVIVPTVSGNQLKLKLSNVYGQSDLTITHITVARSVYDEDAKEYGSRIVRDTCVDVTFSGEKSVVIPAGEEIFSDPVEYVVTAMEPISVSLYLSKANEIRCAGFSGGHSYLAAGLTDLSDNERLGLVNIKMSYGLISVVPVLSSVDVLSDNEDAYSVVVIGDSTVANDFPLRLAENLNAMGYEHIGVVGKGIIGNSLLSDGIGIGSCVYGDSLLHRFDADALGQSGVEVVVCKIGCNDIIHPRSGDNAEKYGVTQPTAEELEAGFAELADRCHAAGIRLIMAYLGPWNGYTRDFFGTGPKYTFRAEDWEIACEVNEWIRTADCFDGILDLNTCCTSPEDPATILPAYTGDGAHPNEKLQKLWGEIFPVGLIGATPRVTRIELNKALICITKDELYDLNETVFPSDAIDTGVDWSSLDSSVASVDEYGIVKGEDIGLTAVTCQSATRDVRARCLVAVCDIALSGTEASLYTGQQLHLKPVCSPSLLSVDSFGWSTSSAKVATVDQSGTVTAKGAGTCVITCVRNDCGAKAECTLTVTKKVNVRSVTLNKTEKTLPMGKTFTLKGTVSPSNASVKGVKYSSSNSAVASVSAKGVVTAKSRGVCNIMCKSADSDKNAICVVTVTGPAVSSVKLSRTSATINGKGSALLNATVSPANAENVSVRWSSSDPSVAKVSAAGKVTSVSPGKCVITCTTVSGKKTATCNITVKRVHVSSVKLSQKTAQLNKGEKLTLTATVSPANATDRKVTWASDNKKVATVTEKGVVKAVSAGTAVIRCVTKDGKLKAICTVTVLGTPVFAVKLNTKAVTLKKGVSYQLKATVLPKDAQNKAVKWSSSDPKIVSVSAKGKLKALKKGSAVITVKTVEGACREKCKVTVS